MNNVRLLLAGTSNGKPGSLFYNELHFPSREEKNDFLPRLWATRRVGWLMEQIRTNGDNKELRDEIVDLGTRYGIVTPYTSYLAVESEAAQPIVRFSTGGAQNRAPGSAGAPAPRPQARAMTGIAG